MPSVIEAFLCHIFQTQKKDKAKAAYGKFSSEWQRLSTEQALCLGKLAEPELLKLANNAEKLLQKLYEHPSILLPDGADKPGNIYILIILYLFL